MSYMVCNQQITHKSEHASNAYTQRTHTHTHAQVHFRLSNKHTIHKFLIPHQRCIHATRTWTNARLVDISALNHHAWKQIFHRQSILPTWAGHSPPSVYSEYVEELRRREYDGESLHGYLQDDPDQHKQLLIIINVPHHQSQTHNLIPYE